MNDFVDDVIATNPNSLILSEYPSHSDYIKKITNTFNYKHYTPKIITLKTHNWNIDKKYIFSGLRMIYYASYLELFIEDELIETYCNLFRNYLKCIFDGVNDPLFRDNNGNTIFHYDAIQGKSRLRYYKQIEDIYNKSTCLELGLDVDYFNVDVLSIKNSSNLSVLDILNCNNDIIIK